MNRSTDRILTTHTGSLPRPPELEQAMLRVADDAQTDSSELTELIRHAVPEVVARQLGCGIDIVGDGEYSKPSYATYVQDRLEGFGGRSERRRNADLLDFPDAERQLEFGPSGPVVQACVGPIRRRDDAADSVARDIKALTAAASAEGATEAFMTAVSPATVPLHVDNHHYPDREAFVIALGEAMKPEYRAIVEAGLILQVDCPDIGCSHRIAPGDSVETARRDLAFNIEVLDDALAGLPADRIRMHVCWGNSERPHHRDIAFADIARIVFGARPQGLVLEAANPRHEHEWQVFGDLPLPDGKILFPGVIDSTTNYVEHPELVAQRLARYADVVGRENVVATTDCGFGTTVGGSAVAPSIAWAKLEAMAQGAEIASRRLW